MDSNKTMRNTLERRFYDSNAYDLVYTTTMQRIMSQASSQSELALQMLAWVTCSREPLTASELLKLLRVGSGKTELGEESMTDLDDMISACVGLVTIDTGSNLVRMAHFTAQEYFQRTRQQWFPDAEAMMARDLKSFEMKVAVERDNQAMNQNQADDCAFSDISTDSGSIISIISVVFSNATGYTSSTALTEPIRKDGVQVFAESILRNESFRSICKTALLEKQIREPAFRRNFRRLLQIFTSELARDPQNRRHQVIVNFVKDASSSIADQVVRIISGERTEPGLDEFSVRQLGRTDPRIRVAEFIEHSEKPAEKSTPTNHLVTTDEAIESDSNDDDSSVGDAAFDSLYNAGLHGLHDAALDNVQNAASDGLHNAALDGLHQVETMWFSSDAFENFTRRLYEFVHPSFRSILMSWISKQRRGNKFRPKQLRDLEKLVSELQYIAPDQISIDVIKTTTVANYLKGIVEDVTGETWDWWPLKPRMRTLMEGEVRLSWICVSKPGTRLGTKI
jgi:hypothetical protein